MKHRLRRALAAVAVLASSLVAGTATPALATTTYSYIDYVNHARLYSIIENQHDDPASQDAMYQVIAVSFGSAPGGYYDFGDHTNGSVQATGGSATLYMTWESQYYSYYDPVTDTWPENCIGRAGNPTSALIEIRRASDNTQVGSTDWVPSISGCDNFGAPATKTVYFDTNPLDAVNDTAANPLPAGNYYIYVKAQGGTANITGQDSVADATNTACTNIGCGPNNFNEYSGKGTFTVTPAYQYLNGVNGAPGIDDVAANETLQGPVDGSHPSGTEKNFSLVREFEQSWSTAPNSTKLNTWVRDEGKVMLWSNKPKNHGVAWSCAQTGTQFPLEACSGTSPWAASAADTTTLNAQALALNNAVAAAHTAGNNVPFIGWTIHHEPHDDAILDYAKGWASGKCGTASDAGADPAGTKLPCDGKAADYRSLYAAMHTAQQNACSGVCQYVKIIYIAVGSNQYYEGSGSKATSTVGQGDQMRPASTDYDIIGSDTYNYSCFSAGLQPDNFSDGVGNGTTTFTSATAAFVAGDVGLKLEVRGVGVFTISSRTNATTVVLSGTVPSGTGKAFGIFRGTNCSQSKWESFEEIVDLSTAATDVAGERYTVLGLGRKLNKKVILAEYASHPGCNGTDYGLNEGCYGSSTDDINGADGQKDFDRGAWFQQMYNYLTTDSDPINYLLGFSYFHSEGTDLSTGDHDWRFLPVVDHSGDNAYVKSGTVGRSVWQTTIGSDANFVTNSEDFTRSLS